MALATEKQWMFLMSGEFGETRGRNVAFGLLSAVVGLKTWTVAKKQFFFQTYSFKVFAFPPNALPKENPEDSDGAKCDVCTANTNCERAGLGTKRFKAQKHRLACMGLVVRSA